MKEIKIDKKIEQEVETMVLLAKQISNLNINYSVCWSILKEQFNLQDYPRNNIPDDIENLKISLYAEIIKKNNKNKVLKEEKINKKIRGDR